MGRNPKSRVSVTGRICRDPCQTRGTVGCWQEGAVTLKANRCSPMSRRFQEMRTVLGTMFPALRLR
jgi:hypothetical protein